MKYTIGEAARELGMAPSAIRYYDSLGIIPQLKRSGGIRVFDEKDMERLRFIECLKYSGMNMREIREFFDMVDSKRDVPRRRDLFYRKREDVQRMIEELAVTEKILKYKCWIYDKAIENGSDDPACYAYDESMPADIALGRDLLYKRHEK